MSLTERTEITERREKAKNAVVDFCMTQKPTTAVLLCESQSICGNRREPGKCGRKIFEFGKKLPANSLFSCSSLSVLSVNSSEPCERVRNRRCLFGFTLVELLIVIALMAIITGITVPAFVGMGRGAGMRGAVSSVRSTLSLLRQWAITHREEVTFHYFDGGASSASYYYATASGALIEKTNELPLEVRFTENKSITFKTDGGLASGTTPEDIIIADRKTTSQKKTISVNGLTGGIRVE